MLNYPSQLVCAGLQEPEADVVRTNSLPRRDPLELIPHLQCCKGQVGAGLCAQGCWWGSY